MPCATSRTGDNEIFILKEFSLSGETTKFQVSINGRSFKRDRAEPSTSVNPEFSNKLKTRIVLCAYCRVLRVSHS